jgi:hypothetical protein
MKPRSSRGDLGFVAHASESQTVESFIYPSFDLLFVADHKGEHQRNLEATVIGGPQTSKEAITVLFVAEWFGVGPTKRKADAAKRMPPRSMCMLPVPRFPRE